MQVCAWRCEGEHACGCVLWRRGIVVCSQSLGHSPSYFLRQGLSLNMELIDSATWPMSFRPLVLNLQMPDFTCMLEIRDSRLHGRHLQTESSPQFCPYKNPFPTKIIYDPASVSSKTILLPRPCKTPVQPEPQSDWSNSPDQEDSTAAV